MGAVLVPNALATGVAQWKAAGAHPQPPTRWAPATWQKQIPEQSEHLSALPQPIDREDVLAVCAVAATGPEEAMRAFIAAMVWGYGTVGYGAYRTHRVLTTNAEAGERLATAARIARDEGGPAAFAWLAQPEHRLRYLGVAFATKYLFFCAQDHQPALVLDRLVQGWLAKHLNWPLSLDWDVDDYQEYVARMSAWAAEVDVEPGDLEMIVFQLAANADPQSLWSAPELFASTAPDLHAPASAELPDDQTELLLDTLDQAAAMFAQLSGATDLDDVADFRRHVRELKRIVVASGQPVTDR